MQGSSGAPPPDGIIKLDWLQARCHVPAALSRLSHACAELAELQTDAIVEACCYQRHLLHDRL